MSEELRRPDGRFVLGVFIGGLLGALIIFFLGTKEGKKTGKLLEQKGEDLLDELQDKVAEMEEKGKELVKKGEVIKDELLQQWEEKKEAISEDATEKLDNALAHIEALQERGRETTASLRKRLFKNLPKKA